MTHEGESFEQAMKEIEAERRQYRKRAEQEANRRQAEIQQACNLFGSLEQSKR